VRKPLLGLLAVALVLLGAMLPLVLPRHCPVNRAACERIKVGMTRTEVEAILVGPPGDYRTLPSDEGLDLVRFTSLSAPDPNEEMWVGDTGDACVSFTPGGIVAEVSFTEAQPANPSLFAIATWRLWRLKERWLP
jgi:hypothetical protein